MSFVSQNFLPDQELTDANMNQLNENTVFLYDRFIPQIKSGALSETQMGFFVIQFTIDPYANGGNGLYGATWAKLWTNANAFAIQVNIPDTIFSDTPFIVGHSSGSEAQWGIAVCSRWDETPTGYKVAFVDTGGPQYPINTVFAYTALLLGKRKNEPA